MASIRIIDVPPGEAPMEIRKAWVGLVLPLAGWRSRPTRIAIAGVLSGPKSFLGMVLNCFKLRHERWEGYPVKARAAIEILGRQNPTAGAWWRENAPHLLRPWRRFVFPSNCCQLIRGNDQSA
jgi:hypothetical protein